VLIVAVYCVLGAKFAVGVNVVVFVLATYVTVPGTAAPPAPAADTANVPAAVTVVAFIASLNVAVIFWLMGTLMAPFKGFVEVTVGIVPVVKLQAKLAAKPAPLGSWAPVVTVATYTVFAASEFVGVSVAVVPE
jgi:hypothetical protein